MAKRDLIQLWVRGDDDFRKKVNDKAESLGFMTADYLRKVIEYGIENGTSTFFVKGDDFCSQETTKRHE